MTSSDDDNDDDGDADDDDDDDEAVASLLETILSTAVRFTAIVSLAMIARAPRSAPVPAPAPPAPDPAPDPAADDARASLLPVVVVVLAEEARRWDVSVLMTRERRIGINGSGLGRSACLDVMLSTRRDDDDDEGGDAVVSLTEGTNNVEEERPREATEPREANGEKRSTS